MKKQNNLSLTHNPFKLYMGKYNNINYNDILNFLLNQCNNYQLDKTKTMSIINDDKDANEKVNNRESSSQIKLLNRDKLPFKIITFPYKNFYIIEIYNVFDYLNLLNNTFIINNHKVKIKKCRLYKLFITNIPQSFTLDTLDDIFNKYGPIYKIKLDLDMNTGTHNETGKLIIDNIMIHKNILIDKYKLKKQHGFIIYANK